jgi:hypothetical protein
MALWVSGSCRRLRNEAYGLRIVCFIYVAFRTIGAQGWWRSDVTRVTDGLSRPGNVPVTRATKRGSFSAENGRNTGTRQLWEELKLHQNPSAPIILQLAIRHAACMPHVSMLLTWGSVIVPVGEIAAVISIGKSRLGCQPQRLRPGTVLFRPTLRPL